MYSWFQIVEHLAQRPARRRARIRTLPCRTQRVQQTQPRQCPPGLPGLSELHQLNVQVIVHGAAHEANAGPCYKLAVRTGAALKVWRVDRETLESRTADLCALLGPATKLVAVVHVSNILGEVRNWPPQLFRNHYVYLH